MNQNSQGRPNGSWTLDLWRSPAPPEGLQKEAEHRVALLARQEDFDCCMLAKFGMSVDAISTYTGLTRGRISYRLKKANIKVMDFRRGKGEYAHMVFQYLDKRAARLLTGELRMLQTIENQT